jgi:hypothetical protein
MPNELDVLDTSELDNSIEDLPIEGAFDGQTDDESEEGSADAGTAEGAVNTEDAEGQEGAEGGVESEGSDNQDTPPQADKKEDEPFLKDGDIVYKTKEDAINSHKHKNDLISRMRNQLIAQTGFDPITGKPAQAQGVAVPQQQRPAAQPKADVHDPVSDWTQNPDNYFLAAAKNPVEANLALVDHHFQQHVAPVLGDLLDTMADMQLEVAVSRFASAKTKNEKGEAVLANEGFAEFLESGGMEKTLQENPMLLQQLIQARGSRQWKVFPEILKSAFGIYRGLKTPELVKKATDAAAQKVTANLKKNARAVTVKPTGKQSKQAPVDELAALEAKLGNAKLNQDF